MAELVSKVVDPDDGVGTDYTSLDAWEDALGGTAGGGTPGNLPAGDEIAQALCRSSSGTNDTLPIIIGGWTTGAANYIEILGTDFPDDGIFDDTKYVIHNNDNQSYMIQQTEDYVQFRKIQFKVTATSGTKHNIYVYGQGTSDIYFDSCIFEGVCSGTGASYAVNVNDAEATVTMYNCTVNGFISGADTAFQGISIANAAHFYIFNCTVHNCYQGIKQQSGTVTVKNTVIFNCTDDIVGTVTLSNCATEDGDDSGNNGNITITQKADDWAALVTDAAGGDFSVTDADSQLYDAGEDDIFVEADDIIGTARPQGDHWDIGAHELIVSGGDTHDVAITEAASATDSSNGLTTRTAAIEESGSATDSQTAQADYNATIVEAATAEDTPVAQVDYDAVITEAASASDEQDRSKLLTAAITEAASASDSSNSLRSLVAAIVEATTAEDLSVAQADYIAIIVEAASASDSSNGALDEITAAIVEAANAQDSQVASVDYSVAIVEAASASDAQEGFKTLALIPPAMHAALIDPYSGGAWLWLVEIDFVGYDVIRYARNPENIVYGGHTFTKNNFKLSIPAFTSDGSIPRTILSVAQDADYTLEDIINALAGAFTTSTVKIIRTHEDFFTYEIAALEYTGAIVGLKSNTRWVTFALGIPNPLRQMVPQSRYSSQVCSYARENKFKGIECQYALGDDTCTGLHSDCVTKGNAVHWGGEIGLGLRGLRL